MRLVSVNVGTAQPIASKGGTSGIYKLPVTTPIHIGPLGLEGDAIVDTKHHGGVDQAVYLFSTPDYEWWSAELGRALGPGTFGENLTVSELESAKSNIGDRLRVGGALLEVTSPRIPCATLAARMDDSTFVKRFREAERFGVYCRVIEQGTVQAGEAMVFEPYSGETVSALEMFRLFYTKKYDEALLRRALNGPLHLASRAEYEALLARHEAARAGG
ncbi:MAG: MOSC domain-containing protein [Anaerolineaceae bacterium]